MLIPIAADIIDVSSVWEALSTAHNITQSQELTGFCMAVEAQRWCRNDVRAHQLTQFCNTGGLQDASVLHIKFYFVAAVKLILRCAIDMSTLALLTP